jgi:hypothetical protein
MPSVPDRYSSCSTTGLLSIATESIRKVRSTQRSVATKTSVLGCAQGYQAALLAALACQNGEAPAKQNTVQVLLERATHKLRQWRCKTLLHRRVERLQAQAAVYPGA